MRDASLFLVAAFGVGLAASCSKPAGKPAQQSFATPDAAVDAMFKAISTDDTTALLAIMGPESREIVIGSDAVQAKRERQVVAAAMVERWWLEGDGDTRTLVIGNESFPMAIPLVHEQNRWRFDTAAGKQELLYRRIGRNEISVMAVTSAYVDAQHEYAAASHDGVPRGAYAQHIVSDDGKHNGLYWPVTVNNSPPSPMGDLAARAAAEGYHRSDAERTPYYGYYFKVLTGQGPHAPGGERSWVDNGAMRGGFGLLAWPADPGASGVMTFMVGPDGELRQKDLGAQTAALAAAITAFDPDSTWSEP